MGMKLDPRLASLMDAINEDWAALEAREEAGALVVRLRKGFKSGAELFGQNLEFIP